MTARRVDWSRTTAGLFATSAVVTTLVTAPLAGAGPFIAPMPGEGVARAVAQLTITGTVLVLTGVAVVAGWWGRRPADTGTAVGAAVLAFAWASLFPAVWAVDTWVGGVALVAAAMVPPALLHVSTSLEGGETASRQGRAALVAGGYGIIGILALIHVLSYNPFLDPGCVVRCASVRPVIPSQEIADATAWGLRIAGAFLGLAVAMLGVRALRRPGSSTTWLPVAACGAVEVAWALTPPPEAALGPLLPVRGVTQTVLGLAVLAALMRRLRRHAVLCRMAEEIIEVSPPGSTLDVLIRRLGDPGARLAFHVPGEKAWVNARGARVDELVASPGAQSIVVRREGRAIARISTTAPDLDAADLEEVLGPATLLAMESERTDAELQLRLRQLTDARRQVVEASDDARRHAERDLHDGAQHLLLAATFALQDAVKLANDRREQARTTTLTAMVGEVREAAAELRHLAHGIYPVLLGDAGLVPALEGLARTSVVPVALDASAVPRLAAPIELTVYAAVASATQAASSSPLHLRLTHDGTSVSLAVDGAGLNDAATEAISDRVLALGGTMSVVDQSLRMELPCG